MSRTAFTIKVFGIYLLFLGSALVLGPNLLLPLFGMPPTTEVWIRVLGVVVVNLGVACIAAAEAEALFVFQASIYMRWIVLVCFVLFFLLGLASPALILFGLVDAAGALWTWLTLRRALRAGQRAYPNTRIDPKFSSRFNSRM
jgi:hypothetical protein